MSATLMIKRLSGIVMILALLFIMGAVVRTGGVYAADSSTGKNSIGADNSVCTGDGCSVDLPQPKADSSTVSAIMKILFGIAGVLSVVFVAIGGFKYTVSGGDPAGIASAKNTIIYALVGLAVSVFAFVIVQFVISSV